MRWTPDGDQVIADSLDGALRIWDSDSGREVMTLTAQCEFTPRRQ